MRVEVYLPDHCAGNVASIDKALRKMGAQQRANIADQLEEWLAAKPVEHEDECPACEHEIRFVVETSGDMRMGVGDFLRTLIDRLREP